MEKRNLLNDGPEIREEVEYLLNSYTPLEIFQRMKYCANVLWLATKEDESMSAWDVQSLIIVHEQLYDYMEAMDYLVEEGKFQ